MTLLRFLLLLAVACVLAARAAPACASDEDPQVAEAKSPEATESASSSTPPLPFDPDLAIFTAIVFVVLLLVLRKFAWKPISEALDMREQSIAGEIEQARQSALDATQTLEQYQAQLAAASDEVRELIAQARRDGESTKQRILEEAQDAAQKERDRALADIEAAKNKALSELAQKSVDTAVALAGQVVRREIRPDDHAVLIREAIEKFPSRN